MHWTDNFDGPAGSLPDPNVWRFKEGPHGSELQTYDRNHAKLDGNGNLVITAEKVPTVGPDGRTYQYVSSMIESAGKVEPQYGIIEARMKVPKGTGLWPAFWLVGNDHDTAGSYWPVCGEIDVVEVLGGDVNTAMGSLHGPLVSSPAPASYGKSVALRHLPRAGVDLSTDFHVYSVKWEADKCTFSVDNQAGWPLFKSGFTADQRWVFDHPFWMILNLAVGGWAKTPTADTAFPAQMLVDWVRVRPE